MTGCFLCKAPSLHSILDDGVKAYSQCDFLEGGPCLPCREYVDLDKRIRDTRKALEDMVARQSEVLAKINQLHDPITRHFPTEVISLVFRHALHDKWASFDNLGKRIVDKSLIRGPLFLGSVCRAWRQIAWSSPQLWRIIRLAMKVHHREIEDEDSYRADVLEAWLDRAGQLPLSIRISLWPNPGYTDVDPPHDEDKMTLNLTNILYRKCSRWNELEVQGPEWLYDMMEYGIENASNLHTFRTAVTGQGCSNRLILNCPQFRPTRLELHAVFFKSFKIDWSHVTHITGTWFTSDECIELLRSATRLSYCNLLTVEEAENENVLPPYDQPLIRSNLETLCIIPLVGLQDNPQKCPQRPILKRFILPSLRNIELRGRDIDSLPELIAHSSCSLVTLTMSAEAFEGNVSLQSFLSTVPTLEDIGLTSYSGMSTTEMLYPFFEQIAATSHPTLPFEQIISESNDTAIIVPNLKTLRLNDFFCTDEFWKHLSLIFGPVINIHHTNRRPLKKLTVVRRAEIEKGEDDYIQKDVALKFMELRDGGAILDFRDGNYGNDLLDLSIAHHSSTEYGIVSKLE